MRESFVAVPGSVSASWPLASVVASKRRPEGGMALSLGERRYDLRDRVLVMAILNRTPDSFYDRGVHWDIDAFLDRAETAVAEGADLLDVGGVSAGSELLVGEAEEIDRVVPALEALATRFDVPVSIDTSRAAVLAAACKAGVVLANDISGFGDPDYLPTAVEHHAAVVAVHRNPGPVRTLQPPDGGVREVTDFLLERAEQAQRAGVAHDRIIVDAGLGLGKTAAQSLVLLKETSALAALGYPLLVSASNKAFLGELGGLGLEQRAEASLAAIVYAASHGSRLVRVHDVQGSVRAVGLVEALLQAGGTST